MNRPLLLVAALTLALQPSCGGEGDSLGVTNVSPRGSVGGLVVDAATQQPMEGVKVQVIAGGTIYPAADQPALTDKSGYFAVADVPAGELIVQITPKDPKRHRAVTLATTLEGAAGDFPLDNAALSLGPIGLVPLADKDAAFSVLLVTPDGAPVSTGIKTFLSAPVGWIDLSNGQATPHGVTVVQAATDSLGVATFTGMPDYGSLAGLVGSAGISDQVEVRIPPYDSDKDGNLDFFGKEQSFQVTALDGSQPTLVLGSSTAPKKLLVEAASIAALAGKEGPKLLSSAASSTIYVTFNLPVEQSLSTVTLYDEKGNTLPDSPSVQVTGKVLSITLTNLKEGAEYNLSLRTFAKVDGVLLEGNFGAPVFTPSKKSGKFSVAMAYDTANPGKLLLQFSEPVGTGVANKHLAGGNAVVFFDHDLDESGTVGDAPGEVGASSSAVTLYIDEQDPPGPAGKSGLSSSWHLSLPTDSLGNPVPAGTTMYLLFSHSSAPMQRGDGQLVPDLKGLTLPY